MYKKILLSALTACIIMFTSCGKSSDKILKIMLDIDWFTSYEDVKDKMTAYMLIDEREVNAQNVSQKMLDYSDVELFEHACDLTLCFTDYGLIGFNYHDVERNQNYEDWYSTLESVYGLPTEEGNGMASWYDNPAGKDTAIYLFNLEEGVQVSIYATADSPDKSYERKDDVYVPTPEIRTPLVPVTDEQTSTGFVDNKNADESAVTTTVERYHENDRNVSSMGVNDNYIFTVTNVASEIVNDTVGETVTTENPGNTSITTDKDGKPITTDYEEGDNKHSTTITTTVAIEDKTEPEEDRTKSFLLNGLQFYGDPDKERGKMSNFTQLYEYRTDEPGQPWELIMEYENVPYEGKNCDGVLCFTSLGLVGVNYFDNNTSDYNYWVKRLTEIYGSPNETKYDYTAWSENPVGNGTIIYVFALEDGVQISFFADDTGSEISIR